MKKFIIQIVLLLLVIGVGIVFFTPGRSSNVEIPFLPQKPKMANLQINDKSLKVEIADTNAKRSKGLSNRDSLGEFEGMLFIFDRADKYPFWMKGLKFPLDFVWIRGDKVMDVIENVQPPSPGQPDSSLPTFSSRIEIDKVLEINAGTVQKLNIKTGDTVQITPQ